MKAKAIQPAPRMPDRSALECAQLLPYQWKWIDDAGDFVVCVKSRQIGISFAEAYRVVDLRLRGIRVCNYWYSSADEGAAAVFINHCKYWLGVWGRIAEIYEVEEVFDGVKQKTMAIDIPVRLRDGREVVIKIGALSSNPTAMRSKSGDVTLDEYDFHKNQLAMMSAAQPVTMRGYHLRVISSINGKRDLDALRIIGLRVAAGQARPIDPAISLHVIDIHQACDEGLVESINRQNGTKYTVESFKAALRAKCRTQAQWEQEYECKPASDTDSYFPHELTRPLVDLRAPFTANTMWMFLTRADTHTKEAVAIVAGVDVGRYKDRFVLRLRARIGGRWKLVGSLEFQNEPWSKMEAACAEVMEWNSSSVHASGRRVRKMCIDRTGIGDMLAERLVNQYRSRVEGVVFTSESKAHLAEQMRVACEEGAITLEDDTITLNQYAGVSKVQTKTGRYRYDAAADETGHSDRFWADALCTEAGADYSRKRTGTVSSGRMAL